MTQAQLEATAAAIRRKLTLGVGPAAVWCRAEAEALEDLAAAVAEALATPHVAALTRGREEGPR